MELIDLRKFMFHVFIFVGDNSSDFTVFIYVTERQWE